MPKRIQDADVKGTSEVTDDSRLINDTKIYVSSLSKRLDQAISDEDIGGGSGEVVQYSINQVAHGFSVNDSVYHNGTNWVDAQADDAATLSMGVVTDVVDVDNFTVSQAGKVNVASHGLTVGSWYYLSNTTPALLTSTEPSTGFSQPLVYVEDSNNYIVHDFRASEISAGGPGASGENVAYSFNQTSHGLAVQDVVHHNGTSWVKSTANSAATLGFALVTEVADANNFTVCQVGKVTISSHGLTVGSWYFLSDATAGLLTSTEPTTSGNFSQPIVYAIDANTILVQNFRANEIS